MDKEQLKKIRKQIKVGDFEETMEEKANMLLAMGAKLKEGQRANSWDGVMAMKAYVNRHGSPEERAAADMVVNSWVWAFEERRLHCKVKKLMKLIAGEGDEGGEPEGEAAAGAEAAKPAAAAK